MQIALIKHESPTQQIGVKTLNGNRRTSLHGTKDVKACNWTPPRVNLGRVSSFYSTSDTIRVSLS